MYSTTKQDSASTCEGSEVGLIAGPPQTQRGEEVGDRSAPPSCNTGVSTALVDWIGVTFFRQSVEEVKEMFGGADWIALPYGVMGYRTGWVNGHIKLYADGADGMGVNVQVSGQGCRQMEAAGVESWAKWFASVLNMDAKFTRLDVAIDERAGLLDIEKLLAICADRAVVSRFKECDPRGKINLKTGVNGGRTLSFGEKTSATKIRIYDKWLEQKLPGVGHWVRCELQMRNKNAQVLAIKLLEPDFMRVVAGVIRGLLEFKERGTHSQRERWETLPAWAAFLSDVEKLRLSVSPVVKTVEEVYKWVVKAVAPSLTLLLEAARGDMQVLFDILASGKHRQRAKHKAMLALALS